MLQACTLHPSDHTGEIQLWCSDCSKAFVTSNGKMDFLAEKFASVPNYVEEDMPAKKPR